MTKKKLSISEQIQDMQNKGITFNLTNEKDASHFLKYSTYYFKLKSYEKNYDKYIATIRKGQFINLDFAYLQELSILDTYLRKTILSMALDIEHALKTQLLRDLSENSNDNYALWEIVEVISFGEFIDLYQRYYLSYPSKNDDFSSYLWSIKFLRNAAAHNSCLLNSLKAPYHVTIHKNKEMQFEVSKIKAISPNAREKWLNNPVIHDFIILVFVFVKLIKDRRIKLAFSYFFAYTIYEEQKNFRFFHGNGARTISAFFYYR